MRISDWSSDVCSSALQPARFLQAQLLLELQRRHGRGRLEALVQRGWAHVRRGGEFLDAQRLRITRLDQVDRARDPLRRAVDFAQLAQPARSEEHTSELQSLMPISYAVFCLKKKT